MGCADVCLDMGYDFEPADFFRLSRPRARKEHRCVECYRAIRAGEKYERSSGKSEGDFWSDATCSTCAEIRKAFVCGSWVLGMLWGTIDEEMFPIWNERGPIDCLAKLETKGARDYAMERYDKWCEQRK